MATCVSYRCLLEEIDRQLSSAENHRATAKKGQSPVFTSHQQLSNQSYRENLANLRSSIASLLASQSECSADIKLPDDALIWQIPAFSNNGSVIDRGFCKERSKALQGLRSAKQNNTNEIWSRDTVLKWESDIESSVLLLQGTSQCLEKLERFGVEMVDHLTQKHQVLYLLSPLPSAIYEQSALRGDDILRQLAIQCLQELCPASISDTVSFLAGVNFKFQRCKMGDWFSVLESILSFQQRPSYIILDVGILQRNHQDARSWPASFSQLVHNLRGKTLAKIMIITCRPMDHDPASSVRIVDIDKGPRASLPSPGLALRQTSSAPVVVPPNSNALHETSLPGCNKHMLHSASIQQATPCKAANVPTCHPANVNGRVCRDDDYRNAPMATRNTEPAGFQSSIHTTCQASAAKWFTRLEATHEAIYGHADSRIPYKPVKVAVLDTGFAYTAANDKRALKPYYQRIRKFANFIDGQTDAEARTDPSGHGTAVAVQVLKVSQTVELYICRVVRQTEDDFAPDRLAVERAILKAAAEPAKENPNGGGWGVDIISMSFGWWYDNDAGVRRAIEFARLRGVHMFASTSNFGLLGPPNEILYPARSRYVIAIDAADGLGEQSGITPSSSALNSQETRFCALGSGLSSPNSDKVWSGSSFACPIAAGIGALILEFARQSPLNRCPNVKDCLTETSAMTAILRRMSSERTSGGIRFLLPWKLIGYDRKLASYLIVDELRKEYGPDIGRQVLD